MPKKGQFIREQPATRKRRPNTDSEAWVRRIAFELTSCVPDTRLDDSAQREVAATVAAMFDAGARDAEVAMYLEQSLARAPTTALDWSALARRLHRLAAG
jgi:hypothetical protein